MGTNFYYRKNECNHCNRFDEIHIGKSSGGWKFTFQAQENIDSFEKYKEELKNQTIYDEYRKVIPFNDFIEMVVSKQSQESHFAQYPDGNFIDEKGFEFSICEFS